MVELFLESPVSVGVIGGVLVLIAMFAWINSGSKPALYVAIILLLLTAVSVIISINVKTDREQIQNVLTSVAEAVEENDLEQVLTFVHPHAVEGVMRAKTELPSYKFTEARITGVKSIRVDKRTRPPSAVAEFHVVVSLTGQGNQFNSIRRFVRCFFLNSDGRWLVHDYEHFLPTEGFRDNAQ